MNDSPAKVLLTDAQRRVVADILPEFSDRLKLDEKNSRRISFNTDELQTIQQKAQSAIPSAEDGMKRNSLRHVVDAVADAVESAEGIGSIPASERIYQFKITLLESQPPIWRRIQVGNCTLDKLHERIQTAMGWTNSHLHEFEINGERYGDPYLLDDGFEDFHCIDSTVTKISDILPKSGRRFSFQYEYDFGDRWEHEVLFEGCLRVEKGQRYPICIGGERACPPEDVGGVWGYTEFLEAISDPEHEEHDNYTEWASNFDPDAFDAVKATRRM
jgi:hypothetical protein